MHQPKLEDILDNLHKASGMDIAIVDSNFRVLARRHSGMNFCTYIHQSPQCLERCVASDQENLAEVNGGSRLVCYTCPFGIFEAIAPIKRNGSNIAYLFLSMGIREDRENDETPIKNALAVTSKLNREQLQRALEKVPRYSGERLEAFAAMLPMIAEYIENNGLLGDADQSLGKMIKNYIKENLDQKITLTDLGYRLHCSTVTLTSHFKKEFGITIMEYVLEKRMHLARQLLLEGTCTISEIAEKCGFSDGEYFSKCFKRYHGESPLVWKNSRSARKKAE